MLAIENLRVVYHDVISVLNGISITVQEGEILIIIGANGPERPPCFGLWPG